MVTALKVTSHLGFNVTETMGEYEVDDIIYPSSVCDTLHPSYYVGFTNKF